MVVLVVSVCVTCVTIVNTDLSKEFRTRMRLGVSVLCDKWTHSASIAPDTAWERARKGPRNHLEMNRELPSSWREGTVSEICIDTTTHILRTYPCSHIT